MNLQAMMQSLKILFLLGLRLLGFEVSHRTMYLEKLKIEAYKGDAHAQYEFGYSVMNNKPTINLGIERGQDVAATQREALKWITKSANQGNENARYRLGVIYEKGTETIAVDEREAISWYEKSGYQGNPEAQIKLVEMYREGKGTRRDVEQAVEWEERVEKNTRSKYKKVKIKDAVSSVDRQASFITEIEKTIESIESRGGQARMTDDILEEQYIDHINTLKQEIDKTKNDRSGSTEIMEASIRDYEARKARIRDKVEAYEKSLSEEELTHRRLKIETRNFKDIEYEDIEF